MDAYWESLLGGDAGVDLESAGGIAYCILSDFGMLWDPQDKLETVAGERDSTLLSLLLLEKWKKLGRWSSVVCSVSVVFSLRRINKLLRTTGCSVGATICTLCF